MKYKIGDKVRIKGLEWYNENKNIRNEIIFDTNPHWRFVANQSNYCGQIATITSVGQTAYRLENIPWNWTDEMIEGLVEEENTLKTQSDNMETETHRGYYTTEEENTCEGKKRGVVYFWDNDFADKVELDLSNRELI